MVYGSLCIFDYWPEAKKLGLPDYFRSHSPSIRTECHRWFILLLFFLYPFLICWVPFIYCRAKNKKLPLVDSSLSASQHQEAQQDPGSDDATIGSMIRWTHSTVVYTWIHVNLNLHDTNCYGVTPHQLYNALISIPHPVCLNQFLFCWQNWKKEEVIHIRVWRESTKPSRIFKKQKHQGFFTEYIAT